MAADETRRAERKKKDRVYALRKALKKVQRHIDLDMTYEEVSLLRVGLGVSLRSV